MKRLFIFVCMLFPLSVFATDTICPAGYYPAEYIELEYIESTGTQYIDTGIDVREIIKDKRLFKLETMYQASSTIKSRQLLGIYGVYWGVNESNKYETGLQGSSVSSVSPSLTKFDKVEFVAQNTSSPYRELKINNLDVAKYTTLLTPARGNFYLCGYNPGDSTYSGLIYNITGKFGVCKAWDDGVLVRDFIPVRRISDGAVGMFDRVENKFYGNDGTGEFIAGPEKTDASFITDENGDIDCVSCPANTYKPNAGNEQCTKCPEHTFSPVGSTSLSDCAKILRVKDYVVYMPLGKRTEHGLCVMMYGKKYCADVYERQ